MRFFIKISQFLQKIFNKINKFLTIFVREDLRGDLWEAHYELLNQGKPKLIAELITFSRCIQLTWVTWQIHIQNRKHRNKHNFIYLEVDNNKVVSKDYHWNSSKTSSQFVHFSKEKQVVYFSSEVKQHGALSRLASKLLKYFLLTMLGFALAYVISISFGALSIAATLLPIVGGWFIRLGILLLCLMASAIILESLR